MRVEIYIAQTRWEVDGGRPLELGVSLDFQGDQPRAFEMPRARSRAVEGDGFVGDRRRGGSVNCETVEITPHGNGTHTEGVGHLTEDRIPVGDAAGEALIAATVLTAPVRHLGSTDETYRGRCDGADRVVCGADFERGFSNLGVGDEFATAVVVRLDRQTTSFDPAADHSGTNPPYLTDQATAWLRDRGCDHLLVELPSIDREDDGGSVPNHHRFFGHRRGDSPSDDSKRRTVTEMIAIADEIDDGPYALSLRFPRFGLDAAPSRPILYRLRRIE